MLSLFITRKGKRLGRRESINVRGSMKESRKSRKEFTMEESKRKKPMVYFNLKLNIVIVKNR